MPQRDQPEQQAVRDAGVWASVIEMRWTAQELAALCKPPKALVLPHGQRQREAVLLMRLRGERRPNAKLV